MLAMVVNDDAGILTSRGDPETIASMLAPTGGARNSRPNGAGTSLYTDYRSKTENSLDEDVAMNTSDLLEQLLRGGMSGMNRPKGGVPQGGGGDLGGLLGGLLGGGAGGGAGLGGLLGGLLGGGSALGGSTRGRSGGGTNYAALASLGMMAFQAYQAWQRSQAAAPQQAQQALRTADLLAGPDVESHSHAVLRALIAAAKAPYIIMTIPHILGSFMLL